MPSNFDVREARATHVVLAGFCLIWLQLLGASLVHAQTSDQTSWNTEISADSSTPTPRHESGVVAVGSNLYLLGGRATRPLEMYDSVAKTWTNLGAMPLELHHFQPVAIGSKIYVIAAFTCCYPNEPSVSDIHVYDTLTQSWSIVGNMPANRARGSAGAVVRNNKIYIVGGNTLGHSGGAVNWFDEYDPVTERWTVLPDAPNARDHFSAVLLGDKLVLAAGRQSGAPNPFANPVAATDVYDFVSGSWQSMNDIPTVRAGVIAADAGDEVIVVGGEIDTTSDALDTVEAFNVNTGVWRELQSMPTARHSGGGARLGSTLHVIAGSKSRGGAPETDAHESLLLDITTNSDLDNDGLSNSEERDVYGTDPQLADSDTDGLNDGIEVGLGTEPLIMDTDEDSLNDGAEVNLHGTSPLLADTDGDNLNDAEELQDYFTNPTLADTDNDGLNDDVEVANEATDVLVADSDNDGLLDGQELALGTLPDNPDTDNDGIVDGNDSMPLSANTNSSSGGSLSYWIMLALLVGSLSRCVLCRVNVSTKKCVYQFSH